MARLLTERAGSLDLIVREDVSGWMRQLLVEAANGFPRMEVERREGGRGRVAIAPGPIGPVLVRTYQRGGLAARLVRDLYWGRGKRPREEMEVTETLRQRGAPVPEALGAVVRRFGPLCYRAWIALRFVEGSRTLWEHCQGPLGENEREALFRAAGEAVRALHACGGIHPDLNLNNVLVREEGGVPKVLIIDLDRARLGANERDLEGMLRRLRRSARKLDPDGRHVTEADLDTLTRTAIGSDPR